jgi:D-glycero-D-manno-heptose 1,7-bisphosphate phosphatase
MKAVFMDRDGVLIEDKGYVHRIRDVVLLPGVPEALKKLKEAGFLLIIASNQSGVGRGYFPESDMWEVDEHLRKALLREGVKIDYSYYCPHAPDQGCDCRKPKPGMLLQAAKEHGIALSESWMVGDKESDMEAGKAAGCMTALVGGAAPSDYGADIRAKDLPSALRLMLGS